jgi:hypothetical protein
MTIAAPDCWARMGPLVGDAGAEVADGDTDGKAPGRLLENRRRDPFAFIVGEGELLGIVRQDAHPVARAIDQVVDHAALALQVQALVIREHGRRHRDDAGDDPRRPVHTVTLAPGSVRGRT